MRIISGTMRGKKLLSLEGEAVRPTSDRVKEALFDILQFRIEGRLAWRPSAGGRERLCWWTPPGPPSR